MPFAPPTHQLAKLEGASRHIVVADERDYKRWYKLAVWTKVLRPKTLRRYRFTCAMCGANWGHDTSRLVVDHIVPHQGVWSLFRDAENLQLLCDSPCHAKHKQRAEQN